MVTSPYIVRNFCPGDFNQLTELYRASKKINQEESGLTPGILMKKEKKPDYSLHKNLFVACYKAEIAGWADITSEVKIGRAVFCGLIHPCHRRKGVGQILLKQIIKRANKLNLKRAHVCIHERNSAARNFLSHFGFGPVRKFLDLEIDLSKTKRLDSIAKSAGMKSFKHGEEDLLLNIQNRCFSGTWGFCPNRMEDICYYFYLTDSSLEDVIVAREREKIFGYCWTHMLKRRKQSSGEKKGRIHMFGVNPDFQGKGWGKKLLAAGLDYLKEKDAKLVELTVDRENTAALSLYHSQGFYVKALKLWYERILVV